MDPNERRRLRHDGVAARRALAGEDRRAAQDRIVGHVRSLMIDPTEVVGVTIADDGEPDLAAFVETLRERGGQVALPVPAGKDGDHAMHFRRWRVDDELIPGRYGIPCPPDGPQREVVPSVVLVPLVRFDRYGNRLGRGAGYYDRWLATHRPRSFGIAFEVQRADDLDPEPHDVPLDALVTDLGIRWFRPVVDKDGEPCA